MTVVFRPRSPEFEHVSNAEFDVVAFPIGGETTQVWTAEQVSHIPVPGKLPIWVQQNPQGTMQGAWDGAMAREILQRYGAPPETRIALYLGMAVDEHYVHAFDYATKQYLVMLCATPPEVFLNPSTGGGIWTLDITGEAHMTPDADLTEYLQDRSGGWSIGHDDVAEPYWGFSSPVSLAPSNGAISGAVTVSVVLEDDWVSGPRWHRLEGKLVADADAVSGGVYEVPYPTYQEWVASAEMSNKVSGQIHTMMVKRKMDALRKRGVLHDPNAEGDA